LCEVTRILAVRGPLARAALIFFRLAFGYLKWTVKGWASPLRLPFGSASAPTAAEQVCQGTSVLAVVPEIVRG